MRHITIFSIVLFIVIGVTFAQTEQAKKEQSEVKESSKSAPPKAIEKMAAEPEKPAKQEKTAKQEKPAKQEKTAKQEKPAEKATPTNGITVARASICTSIVDHEPQGSSDVFTKGIRKIYCFSEIAGAKDPVTIIHKWYYEYQLVGSVALRVKAARWRTFSTKVITPKSIGNWKVEIVNGSTDKVLDIVTFKVE